MNHIYGNNCGITCGSGEELTGAISWRVSSWALGASYCRWLQAGFWPRLAACALMVTEGRLKCREGGASAFLGQGCSRGSVQKHDSCSMLTPCRRWLPMKEPSLLFCGHSSRSQRKQGSAAGTR